nr:hypothetical protein B0A51_12435 [Rachicladosporium sp. CCFEE 5018]
MLSFRYILAVLAALAATALAGVTSATASTITKSYCTTYLSSKSTSPVKTSSVAITYTKTATRYTTSTPTSIETPPPVTSSSTVVSVTTVTTTASQITDTFTYTSTVITTQVTEAPTVTVSVVVASSTDSTVTSTSTVPAPAGFVPIQTSVGKNPPLKRRDAIEAISPPGGSLIARANALRAAQGKSSCRDPKPQYPKKVACLILVTVIIPKTVTATAKSTTTLTATASTSVVLSTTTVIMTSVVLPTDAASTITTGATITIVSTTTPVTTVTTTSTTTNTVQAPQATYYAQCSNDNFIGTNGWHGPGAASDHYVEGAATAYDCCVLCAQQPGCEYSAFISTSFCSLLYNDAQQCSDTSQFALDQSINRYTASNGCVNAYYDGTS